jgi:hypothetical protein
MDEKLQGSLDDDAYDTAMSLNKALLELEQKLDKISARKAHPGASGKSHLPTAPGKTWSDWEPRRKAREDASHTNEELYRIRLVFVGLASVLHQGART